MEKTRIELWKKLGLNYVHLEIGFLFASGHRPHGNGTSRRFMEMSSLEIIDQ